MTVQQVITRVDETRPNQYSSAQKIAWLNDLEGTIWEEIVETHERPQGMRESFAPYDEEHMTAQLLAPDRHVMVYEYWLYAQMDMANRELDSYSADMAMYNAATDQLVKSWNRDNMPKAKVQAIYYGQRDRARDPRDPLGGGAA